MTVIDSAQLLKVRNLTVDFPSGGRLIHAVRNISFSLGEGEITAIAGESGCGKSVTALSLMALTGKDASISAESEIILFDRESGRQTDILKADRKSLQRIRGRKIAYISQDPFSALDPMYTAGWQVAEALRLREKKAGRKEVLECLRKAGISDCERTASLYPHQMSGGMRQRTVIAMALALSARIIIADEPTSNLDSCLQDEILSLLRNLRDSCGVSILLISHDLNLIGKYADRIIIMHAGQIVESGSRTQVLGSPLHPYTRALLECMKEDERGNLKSIPHSMTDPYSTPNGCAFYERCCERTDECALYRPEMKTLSDGHCFMCWRKEARL